jgi:hypothetical protein
METVRIGGGSASSTFALAEDRREGQLDGWSPFAALGLAPTHVVNSRCHAESGMYGFGCRWSGSAAWLQHLSNAYAYVPIDHKVYFSLLLVGSIYCIAIAFSSVLFLSTIF